ncbi:gluconate 5-dehydrogenase [Thelonectria olida]|uniref:Gluconate 5-dehydrogenase n=1 Tax=Thelonectria olida TaxID=1576542 RepID=A0A9P8W745_9HYPO|nr:gluconate 5-dehydrogenase [Thelonectria olida]
MNSRPLEGRVAVVTDSGRENGIGAAIAFALAQDGASIIVNYVSDSVTPRALAMAKKIEGLGVGAAVIQADVSSPRGAQKLVDGALAAFGGKKIDILDGRLLNATPEVIEKDFGLNAFAGIYTTQVVVPHMPRGGRIINIGTVVSKMVLPGAGVYGAAKAASDFLTVTWAAEAVGEEASAAMTKPLVDLTKAEKRLGTAADRVAEGDTKVDHLCLKAPPLMFAECRAEWLQGDVEEWFVDAGV